MNELEANNKTQTMFVVYSKKSPNAVEALKTYDILDQSIVITNDFDKGNFLGPFFTCIFHSDKHIP